MDVVWDMDRAGGIAGFTCILVQPHLAGGWTMGEFRGRLGSCSFGFSPPDRRAAGTEGLNREPGTGAAAGRSRRVAVSCQALPRHPMHRGLCSVTGLNSRKSITYITRLAQTIIVRRAARTGGNLTQVFTHFHGFISTACRPASDGG